MRQYKPAQNITGLIILLFLVVISLNSNASIETPSSPAAYGVLAIPSANGDSYMGMINEGGTLEIGNPLIAPLPQGVLLNDTDLDGDFLTAVLVTGVSHGDLTLYPNGSFVYEHNGDEIFTDQFTYFATDGSDPSNTVTVALSVLAVNDAPVSLPDNYSGVNEGGVLSVSAGSGVLSNDSDAEGNTLSAVLDTDVQYGDLTLNSNGSFTYTHDGSENFSDSFTYYANDGTDDGNTVSVSISISPLNDAPVFTSTPVTAATQGVAYTYNITTSDAEGNSRTITAPTLPGWLTLSSTSPGGSATLSGTPTNGDAGLNPVVLRVSDGDFTDQSFSINVADVNDPPVLSGIEGTVVNYTEEAPAVTITSTISISDPDNTNLVSARVWISSGLVSAEDRLSLTSVEFVPSYNQSTGVLTITPSGSPTKTLAQFQNALRNVKYNNLNTEDPNEGTRVIRFRVNDGTVNSNEVTRNLSVIAVNDPPEAVGESYTGFSEGTTLVKNSVEGVLANDTDVDGPDPLTAVLVEDVEFGVLTLNANGSFTYDHDGSNNLNDSFTYQVFDGEDYSNEVTASLTATGVNDPPELSGIESSILQYDEDEAPKLITSSIVITDNDNLNMQSATVEIDVNFVPGEDVLTFPVVAGLTINYNATTGVLTATGNQPILTYRNLLRNIRYQNINTADPSTLVRRVSFSVNDGEISSAQVYRNIQVNALNDPPVAEDAYITGSDFLVGDLLTTVYTYSDPDGDPEGNTAFRWYRANTPAGAGRTAIAGVTTDTFTLRLSEGGFYVSSIVDPYDIYNQIGDDDTTAWYYVNAAPTFQDFTVANLVHPGAFAVGEIVTADFTYFDKESNPAGSHEYQWYRSNDGTWGTAQERNGETNYVYQIVPADNNKYIALEARPTATSGSSPGQIYRSGWYLVSEVPSAVISGLDSVCAGQPGILTVSLSGNNPPWDFRYVLQGTTDTLSRTNIAASNSNYELEVEEPGTYILVDVADQVFEFGVVAGSAELANYPTPSATLSEAEIAVCDNADGTFELPVLLTGKSPWSISYGLVGTNDSTFITGIEENPANIELDVEDIGEYEVRFVWDANCFAEGSGTTDVILRENPRALLTGDTIVCPDEPAPLSIELSGGGPWTFSYTRDGSDETDVFVNENVESFEYELMVSEPGIYQVTYVENDEDQGCVYGTANFENHILPTATLSGNQTTCEGSTALFPLTLTGTSPWTIVCEHNAGEPDTITGISQNPYLLPATEEGTYQITAVSDKFCVGNATGSATLSIDPAPEVSIVGLDTLYVNNTLKVQFSVIPEESTYSESDPNTVFVIDDTLTFSPSFAGSANSPHWVRFKYTDPGTGCVGRDSLLIYVLDDVGTITVIGEENEIPERYCANQDTIWIQGINTDNSPGSFTISGPDPTALMPNGNNKAYLLPAKIRTGTRTVTYNFTISGTPQSITRNFSFEEISAGFTWDNECFTDATEVRFEDQSASSGSDLVNHFWTVDYGDEILLADTNLLTLGFDRLDNYPIEYVVVSQYGCTDTINRTFELKPTITINGSEYSQNFNDNAGYWEAGTLEEDPEAAMSWTYGIPEGNVFTNDGVHQQSWYTQIANYADGENSYVIGPCYDFSEADRPMLKMDIWQDLISRSDGANIQYSADGELWLPVGNVSEGINWYNETSIPSPPGGFPSGWSSTTPGWQTARIGLDNLKGNTSPVRFRICYGAPQVPQVRDGFAFDNIWIGERTKKVLVEYFTNMSDTTSKRANAEFNAAINSLGDDVVDIQYHMYYPGPDTFYTLGPQAADSREIYYSLPDVPYAYINGGTNSSFILNLSQISRKVDPSLIRTEALRDNKFDIDITSDLRGNAVGIQVQVTATQDIGERYVTVHTVIVEEKITKITSDLGESTFESVQRAILPEAIGTPFDINWTKGTTRQFTHDYYLDDIFNVQQLRVVVFVQDEENDSKEVFQVAIDNPSGYTSLPGIREDVAGALTVWPNPVTGNQTNISFSEKPDDKAYLQVVDNTGRIVIIERVPSGTSLHRLRIDNLDSGLYLIRYLSKQGNLLGTAKLVIHNDN